MKTKGKLLTALISAALLFFSAVQASAQPDRLNLKMDNVSVKAVLDKIQSMTEYAFFYNNTEIDDSRIV